MGGGRVNEEGGTGGMGGEGEGERTGAARVSVISRFHHLYVLHNPFV